MSKNSDDAEIVAAYQRDDPIEQILAAHRISAPTLYKILRTNGVTPGRRFAARDQEWTPAQLKRIAELHHSGAGVVEIMRAMSAGHVRVARALNQIDAEPRT